MRLQYKYRLVSNISSSSRSIYRPIHRKIDYDENIFSRFSHQDGLERHRHSGGVQQEKLGVMFGP